MKKVCVLGAAVFVLALFSGCGADVEEDAAPLRVCVDSYQLSKMKSLAEAWQVIEGGTEVEFIELPAEGDDAELTLSSLRTELMAGKGPDLFWLTCRLPETVGSYSGLFTNMEKTLESDLFLPLDEYLENAKYVNVEDWNQTILSAGKTEAGQVVLPLYYRLPAYAFKSSDLPAQEVPDTWEALMASENPVLKRALRQKLFLHFTYSFDTLADVQTGKLAFTREELTASLDEYSSFEAEANALSEQSGFGEPVAGGWLDSEFLTRGIGSAVDEELTYVSIPNRAGGITAMVNLFAAINRNSALPDEAFSFLDFILSDEIASSVGFTVNEKRYGSGGIPTPDSEGIFVNQKIFMEANCRNDKAREAFETLTGRIDSVRFYGELDRDLYDLAFYYGGTPDPSEREHMVTASYEDMEMKLAE